MSGLEIVGVILGVIPILQLGLDQFHGERFRALVKYQQTIRSIYRKLELEHAQLHSTCEKLLSPVADEDRVAELLAKPKGSLWKDIDLEEKLMDHLGQKKYELFITTIKELASLIIKLRDDLGLVDRVGLLQKMCSYHVLIGVEEITI
jgi:hypothetical protein